jgi:hypothetical protein
LIGGLSAREFPPGFIFDLTVQRDRPYTFRTLCLISLNLHTQFRFSYFSQKPPVYIIFVDWSLRLACPVTEALTVVCNISNAGPRVGSWNMYKYKFQGKTLDPTPLRILLHLYLPFDCCALSIFKKTVCVPRWPSTGSHRTKTKFPTVNSYILLSGLLSPNQNGWSHARFSEIRSNFSKVYSTENVYLIIHL